MTMIALTTRPPKRQVVIRELRNSDMPACEAFLGHLDRHDIRMRFGLLNFSVEYFLPKPGATDERVAFLALDRTENVLGVLNLGFLGSDTAEVGVIVRSDYKHRGIGRSLLTYAIKWAEGRSLRELIGYVLAQNRAMLTLANTMGFRIARWDSDSFEVRRSLRAAPLPT